MRDIVGVDKGIAEIAKAAKLSRQTVYRIKDSPTDCEAALVAWGFNPTWAQSSAHVDSSSEDPISASLREECFLCCVVTGAGHCRARSSFLE